MKKLLMLLVVFGAALFTLTGCSSYKSYTYDVNTGDKIEVQLKTNDGYDLTSGSPFNIKKNDKTLSTGMFITLDGYNQYNEAFKSSTKIESNTKGNLEYTFYYVNNSEWDYVIKIKDSNTGILLGNPNSEAEAKEVFERLTFTKK
jgi:hypothetical protein